jgi:hypothetical protein
MTAWLAGFKLWDMIVYESAKGKVPRVHQWVNQQSPKGHQAKLELFGVPLACPCIYLLVFPQLQESLQMHCAWCGKQVISYVLSVLSPLSVS